MRKGLKEIALAIASLILAFVSLFNPLVCRIAVFIIYLGLAYIFLWSGILNFVFSKEAPSLEEYLKEIDDIKRKYGVKEE